MVSQVIHIDSKRATSFRVLITAAMMSWLLLGCGRHQDVETSSAPLSPEVEATLGQLNQELRRSMLHHHLTGRFDEFAALRPDLQIPPPPAGKKYAISKNWKVILVDDQTAPK